MFGTRKKLRIAMENQKLLCEELEEKRQLDVERQKEIRKLQQENKTLTEKCEKLKKLEETNIKLGNQIMQDAEIIQNLKAETRVIANENQNKIDELNNKIIELEGKNKSKGKKIKELEKDLEEHNLVVKDNLDLLDESKQLKEKLKSANKEIEDLKKNIRKACNCNNNKSELTKNETTPMEDFANSKYNITNEEATKIIKDIIKGKTKELKSNTPDNHKTIQVDDLSKDVDAKKNEELFDKFKKTKKEKIEITTTENNKKKGRKLRVKKGE